jgi:hypothetical protein
MLCEYEMQLLRDIVNGHPRLWGAAVGQGMEALIGSGYLTAQGRPTDKGRAAVTERPQCGDKESE